MPLAQQYAPVMLRFVTIFGIVTEARHFLYLDRRLVREILAPFEGGIHEEEGRGTNEVSDRSVGAKVGWSVLSLGGRKGKKREEQRTIIAKQTGESEFDRAHSYLKNAEKLQWLEVADTTLWDQLRVGEFLEVQGIVPRRAPIIAGVRRMTIKTADVSTHNDSTDLVVRLRRLEDCPEEYGFFGEVSSDNYLGKVKTLLGRRLNVWQWPGSFRVLGQIIDELEPGKTWQTGAYPWWEQRFESLMSFVNAADLRGNFREISVVAAYQLD